MSKNNDKSRGDVIIGSLLIAFALLIVGISSHSMPDDGVPRNEQGEPLLTYHKEGIIISDHERQMIYQGNTYISSVNINLSAGESYDISGHTDGKMIAMDFREVTVDDLDNNLISVNVNLWEDINLIANGSEVNIFNLERNIPNNNTFEIYQNSTIDYSGGTLIQPLSNIIRSDQRRVILTNSQDQMYIMKENTDYGLEIENTGDGSVNIRFRWVWHEDLKVN